MATRTIGRLTALKVEKAKLPGMYPDGGGLYLRVTPEGTKQWVLRYMLNRRARWMGLGPFSLYSLQEARTKALDARKLRHEGIVRSKHDALNARDSGSKRPRRSRSSNAARRTSARTVPDGGMASTRGSGARLSPLTLIF